MSDLPIASAASLTGATLASNDLVPILDVSATAGSKGSKITVAELFTGRALSSGTHTALTALGLRSTGASFDLTLASSEVLTAGRTLSFNVGDADRVLTIPATGTAAMLGTAQTFSAANIFSVAGAASTPAVKLTGTPFAGTGTTSFPLLYLNQSTATASTTLNAAGTFFGINSHGTQDLINAMVDGASVFKVNYSGNIYSNVLSIYSYGANIVSFDINYGLSVNGGNIAISSGNLGANIGWGTYSGFSAGFFRRADAHVGLGTASATPIAQTFGGAQGLGTDITGGALNIGTRGTGTGTGGVINLQTHAAGTTGSTLGTLVNVLSIVAPGQVKITGIPTASAGLASGTIWSNAGVLTIV